jgi:hypothetical protein
MRVDKVRHLESDLPQTLRIRIVGQQRSRVAHPRCLPKDGVSNRMTSSLGVRMADIDASVRQELPKVDPTPFFQKDGENAWAAVKGYLDACTDAAAAPVIEKYRDVLAAADVFTPSTTFWVMESIRLDLGFASYVHP